MLLRAVAVRYADALYSLGKEAGGLDKVAADLELAATTVSGHEGLSRNLFSPTVPDVIKRSLMQKIFEGKVSDTVLRFLYVLVDKNREEYLPTILEVFQERLRQDRGEVECRVSSAKALTSALRKDLQKSLSDFTGKKVQLIEEVEPELLAGMVIVVGDRVIDTSFRHQLREIEDRLSRA